MCPLTGTKYTFSQSDVGSGNDSASVTIDSTGVWNYPFLQAQEEPLNRHCKYFQTGGGRRTSI